MHTRSLLLLLAFFSCSNHQPIESEKVNTIAVNTSTNPYPSIGSIPVPAGFKRLPATAGSFPAWLEQLPLKSNKTVYLYNGQPKQNQSAQFAVIDISTGNKDLQQCADAVMRLRAEYLYNRKDSLPIDFTDNNQTHYRLATSADRNSFDKYLEKVFSYCGTASLEKQLQGVHNFNQVMPGHVLIRGGYPGHAMQVMDVAVNAAGKKLFLLAQGYMPAQDMHVVINPGNTQLSPWYEENNLALIQTPEWTFKSSELKKWPAD